MIDICLQLVRRLVQFSKLRVDGSQQCNHLNSEGGAVQDAHLSQEVILS
jgi:hypothetical protein